MRYHFSNRIRALGLILIVAFVATAHAGDHQPLTPLLIDLQGWEAENPEGMSMDMGAMKMTNATRTYTKDDNSITAMVMIGSHAMTQGQMQEMKVETTDVKVSVSEIDGFQVHTGYDKNENAGSVTVFLSQGQTESALFMVSYQNLSEKEAMDLVKDFDWKKMKAVVDKLL
ncbi:hypothetical protein ACFL03_01210 [Thermodesulfobacteriota bacterium]